MNHLLKISQQAFWQILGKVVTTFSTFIILGIIARNYGQAGTGVFTLSLIYLGIFYLLADFGFNAHVLKQVQHEWNKLLGTRILWSAGLVILAVGLLPFWPFSTPIFSQAVIFGSLAIIASSIFVTCNLVFQSKLRYDLSIIASSFGVIFSLLIFILLSLNKFSIPFLLLSHLIGWMLIALMALVLVRGFKKEIYPVFDKLYTIKLFKDSWPVAATLVLNVIYFRADSFILSYFKGSAEVGIYNIAYSVFQSALVIPTFIMNAYYPLMLKSLKAVKLIGSLFVIISLLGTLITIFFSSLIINLLAGSNFNNSIQLLQILSLGFPAFFLSSLLMWILITKGRYKIMLLLYTSGTILNLILNFIYIPKFSYYAASWITVISEYFILLLQIMVLLLGKKRVRK